MNDKSKFVYAVEWKDSDCGWLPVFHRGTETMVIFDTEVEAQKYQQDNHFGLSNFRVRKVKSQ